jgi:hypothetical protein
MRMVRTLRDESQYSEIWTGTSVYYPFVMGYRVVITHLPIRFHMHRIHTDQEAPECDTQYPRMSMPPAARGEPEAEDELGGGEVPGEGDGVVEPVVPAQGECVGGRDEAGGVSCE